MYRPSDDTGGSIIPCQPQIRSPATYSIAAVSDMEQTFVIEGRPDLRFDGQGDAAQEAEFLHAETGRQHRVLLDGEVVYESQGAPE